MKKTHVMLAVVPAICALAGYGLGAVLGPSSAAAQGEIHEAPKSEAEQVLSRLADEMPAHGTKEGEVFKSADGHKTPAETGIVPASFKTTDVHRKADMKDKGHEAPQHKAPVKELADPTKVAGQTPEKAAPDAVNLTKPEMDIQPGTTGHPLLLPVETEKRIAEDAIKRIKESEKHVVKLGRMTVPVYKAQSITYVVADFGISVTDLDEASHYYAAENATRLRDAIMKSMHTAAETHILQASAIDEDMLARKLSKDLKTNFKGVEDVLFLSLYKTDVPRG